MENEPAAAGAAGTQEVQQSRETRNFGPPAVAVSAPPAGGSPAAAEYADAQLETALDRLSLRSPAVNTPPAPLPGSVPAAASLMQASVAQPASATDAQLLRATPAEILRTSASAAAVAEQPALPAAAPQLNEPAAVTWQQPSAPAPGDAFPLEARAPVQLGADTVAAAPSSSAPQPPLADTGISEAASSAGPSAAPVQPPPPPLQAAGAAATVAASTAEPQTPQHQPIRVILKIPAAAAKTAADEVSSSTADTAAGHIQVSMSKDDAADLAEQLQAVSLAPATPPAKPVQQDLRVGLVYDPLMEDHVGPLGHYERPARTAELFRHITDTGLAARCWTLPARKARDEELLLGHTAEHIAGVEAGYDPAAPPPAGDIYWSSGTAVAARIAAGSTIEAVEQVMRGNVRRALAVVRPPGHHAECSHAMGFCFYSNLALAALSALRQGARRVLIFDWDVHHGNGTERILEADPRVLYMSLHRGKGFFPGTGASADVGKDAGRGFTVNVPWARAGAGDADYLAAWQLVLGPIVTAFDPDLVLVSAGFDAAEGDPLGGCRLTPHGYGKLTEALLRQAGGRCVLALEGGYNTRVTSEAAAACLGVLLGGPAPAPDPFAAPRPMKETQPALAAAAEAQAPFWPVLAPIATADTFLVQWRNHLDAIPTPKSSRKTRQNSKHLDFVVYT